MSNKIEQTSFDGSFDGMGFEHEFQDEILDKTKSIIEDFTGSKVEIQYQGLPAGDEYQVECFNYSSTDYRDNTIRITISDYSSDRKTSLEKAMAEILYGSDRRKVNELSRSKTINIPNPNWRETAKQSYMEAYEILNRLRCNSAIGKQYKGTNDRIIKNDSEMEYTGNIENPIEVLKARLCNVNIDESEFDGKVIDQYLERAKGMSRKGIVKLADNFYSEMVEPWLLNNLKELEQNPPEPEPPAPEGEEGNEEEDSSGEQKSDEQKSDEQEEEGQDKQGDEKGNTANIDLEDDGDDDGDDLTEQKGLDGKAWKSKETLEDLKNQLEEKYGNSETCPQIEDSDNDGEYFDESDIDKTDLDDELEAGEKEFESVDEKLMDEKLSSQTTGYAKVKDKITVHELDGRPQKISINQVLVRKLSKTFSRILQSTGEDNEVEGYELDMNAFINSRTDGRTDYFITEADTTGFSCVIGIDLSGSMANGSLDICKTIVGNLLESVKKIPRVQVKVIGWSGSSSYTSILEANNIEELSQFRTSGMTPMANGMWYCKNTLDKMNGNKKVMFFLTDGMPNDEEDIPQVKEAVNLLRNSKASVLGIGIGTDGYGFPTMFGKGWVSVRNALEVERVLQKDFIKEVSSFLRGN